MKQPLSPSATEFHRPCDGTINQCCSPVPDLPLLGGRLWTAHGGASRQSDGSRRKKALPSFEKSWRRTRAHKDDGIRTPFSMVYATQIGIPEGALDVKRALTGRAIFSRPEAEFWSVACRTRDAQGRVEEDPPGFPNRLLIRADGLSSARWVPKIARRRAAVKGGRRPSREGCEDRRRSEAKPRTGAPLRADRRCATARATAGSGG